MFLPLSLMAATTDVTLYWDASTNPIVAGYKIYYGTACREYTNVVVAGNIASATVTNLQSGTTYYFAATTYDAAGNESSFSEEVSYTVPNTAPEAGTLTAVGQSSGRFSFTVTGTPGADYIVQASTNLVDWESVQTNTAPFDFVDAEAGSYSQRYYRTATLR